MLNLLKIRVTGFKLLKDNFEIDLTTKARVYESDKAKEIQEVDKGLYLFRTNAFVGGNSSGKSTVLSLILKTLVFLQTGRWKYLQREFKKSKILLNIIFYLDGYIYDYQTSFSKIDVNNLLSDNSYAPINEISLKKLRYSKSKGIKCLDYILKDGEDLDYILKSSLDDTSAIKTITGNNVIVDDFSNNNISNLNETILRKTFFNSLNSCDKELVSSIIQLLDDSIEYIYYENSDYVRFKRANESEELMPTINLAAILSAGTFRGVELYIRCINALKNGATIIVDEIENCFQKNLVYNLLFLFNDEKINSKNAKLLFSTHYVEILDYLNRRDGIFITHKENGIIDIKNLYKDYSLRTELSKSKQFDNNVFNTAINYKQLLKVNRSLLNELQANNDWRNRWISIKRNH